MKSFAVLASLLALAAATVDFDSYEPIANKFLKNPEEYPIYAFLAGQTPTRGGRIVGGQEATPGQFPYQTLCFIDASGGRYQCGGSLIYPGWVLTAAHCVDDVKNGVDVTAGAHNARNPEPTQVTRFVVPSGVFVHPEWDRRNAYNDIALLKLPTPIESTPSINTIPLPTASDEDPVQFEGVTAVTSGWGLTRDGSSVAPAVLHYVETNVITNVECRSTFGSTIKNEHICASGAGGKGSCSGDSGGPLVYEGRQLGVVSFGSSRGCEVGAPHVYTRVVRYLKWISEVTGL